MKVLTGKDILLQRTVFHICLQFQPRDAWLGAYIESLHPFAAYVCLIPCFPLHIKLLRYSRSVTV